ncbi:type II toxin-antitoxin system RelE/ParE family toxin [Desulfovibrio sp. ZJ200]|uniref:type II toxin-antitoxin system RelE/ParE family toxin n=1 Tax=Desulfovibrio sp. ZJ200 TaxID=2709792 RepID=UPI001F14F2DF|nr:type II toxin-antitoxin system RelE/ParE family toxin [Desulfovibrio sp. ZJ200]
MPIDVYNLYAILFAMNWSVEFLNETVRAEFLALPKDMLASLLKIVEMVEDYGLQRVGMPYVRHLQGKLWEMRGKSKDGIARSIYVAVSGRRVIVVRSFVKKTQQTPDREIKLALQRAKEIME